MTFRLSDADIRLLHIFKAVVDSRGFSNAQTMLNVTQSNISNQMARLEQRLGMRLCERGRGGFKLTLQGERVHAETLQLFKAHEHFRNNTSEIKGRLIGFLNIALIDNVVTDPACPIVPALRQFNRREHEVSIRIDIMPPGDIERKLLEEEIDVAIGTFHHRIPGLHYRKIYVETNALLCGRSHAIYKATEPARIRKFVRESRKVGRGYLEDNDLADLGSNPRKPNAVVHNLEAAAVLILGGGHIGFLPHHYCESWLADGRMKAILPGEYAYASEFSLVTRRTKKNSMILSTFLEALNEAAAQTTSVNDR